MFAMYFVFLKTLWVKYLIRAITTNSPLKLSNEFFMGSLPQRSGKDHEAIKMKFYAIWET